MDRKPIYGPNNPHPLSKLSTELVWDGKYDEYGNRREVDIAGCAMPMQRIETIDQPRSEAAATGQLPLFEKQTKRQDDFPNQVLLGKQQGNAKKLFNGQRWSSFSARYACKTVSAYKALL